MPRDVPPAVEAERELVEIGLELRGLHAALVGAQRPALGQRSDAMHAGQQIVGLLLGWGDRLGSGLRKRARSWLLRGSLSTAAFV